MELFQEAAHCKNINRGNRLASSYELLFGRPPRIPGIEEQTTARLASVRENNYHIMRQRVQKMLKSAVRDPPSVQVNYDVYIWCDDSGWVCPARVNKVNLKIY